MCFAGKFSILAQRINAMHMLLKEENQKDHLGRYWRTDADLSRTCTWEGTKAQEGTTEYKTGKKSQTWDFLYVTLSMKKADFKFVTNRFTCIQIIKLEQDNFATQRTQFNWTEESNKMLAEGSVPLLLLLHFWVHSFPIPAFWSITHISFFNGNHSCKLY